jgi:hypothetical protein
MSNHLSTPVAAAGRSHCRFCHRKLSLIHRIFDSEFCRSSHQSAYAQQQQEMFLARLRMHEGFLADNPIPAPPLATSKAVTLEIEPIAFSSFIKC